MNLYPGDMMPNFGAPPGLGEGNGANSNGAPPGFDPNAPNPLDALFSSMPNPEGLDDAKVMEDLKNGCPTQ